MYADQIDFSRFSGYGLFLNKNYVYNDTVNMKSIEISLMCNDIELCQSNGNSKHHCIIAIYSEKQQTKSIHHEPPIMHQSW